MTNEAHQPRKFLAISECEICKHLEDEDTSFVKYGHAEETLTLPAEAARLVRLKDSQVSDTDRREFERCPVCGTFYLYKFTYEYLTNGSEDEEELTRATPTEAKRFLSDEEYRALIESMAIQLQHASERTRFFAAKSLVSHHLEHQDMTAISQYLRHRDVEVVKGALVFLAQFVKDRYALEGAFRELQEILAELGSRGEELVAGYARYVARSIDKYAERPKPEDSSSPS